MYNKVILIGRVGADAECKSAKHPVTFSLATWENYRDENEESGWKKVTTWHDIVVWGKEDIKRHYVNKTKKGILVQVEGKITENKWEDEEGNKRKTVRVVCDYVKIIPTGATSGGTSAKPNVPATKPKETSSWGDEDSTDDLPF